MVAVVKSLKHAVLERECFAGHVGQACDCLLGLPATESGAMLQLVMVMLLLAVYNLATHPIVPCLCAMCQSATGPLQVGSVAQGCVAIQVRGKLHLHRLASLSHTAAMELFRTACCRPLEVSEKVEEEVVKACGGLPLAVQIVSGCLADQDDPAVWKVRMPGCYHLKLYSVCCLASS